MRNQIAFACITVVLAASIIYIISRLRRLDDHVQHLHKAQQMAISREEFEEYQQHRDPTVLMCAVKPPVGTPVSPLQSCAKVEEIDDEQAGGSEESEEVSSTRAEAHDSSAGEASDPEPGEAGEEQGQETPPEAKAEYVDVTA